MTCKKCKVKWKIYVDLCPLHAAAGKLLEAAKVIEDKFFNKKQWITAVEMVPLVEAITKAEKGKG